MYNTIQGFPADPPQIRSFYYKPPSLPKLHIGQSSMKEPSQTNTSLTFFKQRFNQHSVKELNTQKRIEDLKNKFNINRFIVSPANKNRETAFPQKRVSLICNQMLLEEERNIFKKKRPVGSIDMSYQQNSQSIIQQQQQESQIGTPQQNQKRLSQLEINHKAIQMKNPNSIIRQKRGQFFNAPLLTIHQHTRFITQGEEFQSYLHIKKCQSQDEFEKHKSPFKKIMTMKIDNISNLKQMMINPFMDMQDLKFNIVKQKNNFGIESSASNSRRGGRPRFKKSITLSNNQKVRFSLKGIYMSIIDSDGNIRQKIKMDVEKSFKVMLFPEQELSQQIFEELFYKDGKLQIDQDKLIKNLYSRYQLNETRQNYRTICGRLVIDRQDFYVKIKQSLQTTQIQFRMPYVKVYDSKLGRTMILYLDLSIVLGLIQNGIDLWHQQVTFQQSNEIQVKAMIDFYYNQLDQVKDIFKNKYKIKNQKIYPIQSKTYDYMIENLSTKPYMLFKRFSTQIMIIIYKNFQYELNDELGTLIGKLECPIKYVNDMLKYQRFQGNLSEKVAEELIITFDDNKKAFKIECDLSKVQTEQIGEAFFKSVSINPYFIKETVSISYSQNKTFQLLLKPAQVKYITNETQTLLELKFDQVHNLSKQNFINWEKFIPKISPK
ncbi:UNKNOWN [Stylonychia lemnae]|uniref:Uncharacterized protein n=1 Tax=Stylonychia lemnae TaxID=5949 RepID=A0A078AWZ0_STYLE|nr:UNKNOWN [Stylonychia lemnae]|eukprot:CDW86684.1 UNKNOWN [Stylonychia lemnae]